MRSKKLSLSNLFTARSSFRSVLIDGTQHTIADWNKVVPLKQKGEHWLYIALPPSLHYSYAVQGLKKGFNLIIEKPLSTNRASSEKLFKISESMKLKLFEVNMYPFHNQFQLLRNYYSFMEEGTIDVRFSIPKLPKDDFRYNNDLGGGAILDLGFYPLSLLVLLSKKFELLEQKIVYKNNLDTSGSVSAIMDNRIRFKGSWALNSTYANKLEFKSKDFGIKCRRVFSKPHDLKTKIFYYNEKKYTEILVDAEDHFLKMIEAFVTNKNILWTKADTIKTIDFIDKLRLK